jgi:hypothetical protein
LCLCVPSNSNRKLELGNRKTHLNNDDNDWTPLTAQREVSAARADCRRKRSWGVF